MKKLKTMRIIQYTSFFFLAFLFFLYFTFPTTPLKNFMINQGQKFFGPEASVQINKVSLWRLSGIKLKGISIASDKTSSPLSFDTAGGRIGIFSLLTGKKSISFFAQSKFLDLDGNFRLNKKQDLESLK